MCNERTGGTGRRRIGCQPPSLGSSCAEEGLEAGSARREAIDCRSSLRVISTHQPIGPPCDLVVRREPDLAANLVELARLAERQAQPTPYGP